MEISKSNALLGLIILIMAGVIYYLYADRSDLQAELNEYQDMYQAMDQLERDAETFIEQLASGGDVHEYFSDNLLEQMTDDNDEHVPEEEYMSPTESEIRQYTTVIQDDEESAHTYAEMFQRYETGGKSDLDDYTQTIEVQAEWTRDDEMWLVTDIDYQLHDQEVEGEDENDEN